MVTIDDMTLDAALSEKHSMTVQLTEHPVENGTNPIDHARTNPNTYSVEGIFTNLPLTTEAQKDRGNTERGTDGFAQQMASKLRQLMDSHRAISISTELRTYENMVMLSLDMPRDPGLGDVVQFSASFKEVRFVNSQSARLVKSKSMANKKKPGDKENQAKQPAQTASAKKKNTLALGLKNFATGN